MQLFNFQWLARPAARSLFLLFTYGSRRQLFKDQVFFEQLAKQPAVLFLPWSGRAPMPSSSAASV